MRLKRYVMLLDEEAGPLARLVPRLRELDFRVILAPDARVAIEFVTAFPKLSMVAVCATQNPELDQQVLTRIRELQPDLPLLWYGPPTSLPPGQNTEVLPRESVTAGDLVASAERLLRQHFYPVDFTTLVAEAAVSAFSCFGVPATSVEALLKASHARLGELSAVIAFSGPQTSGHMVTSASRKVVLAAYERIFDDASPPGDDALVDVLGECSNRIVGKLAMYFEARGLRLTFGVPLYVTSADCVLWQGAFRPSLAIEFETLHGRLFAELCIDTFDPPTPDAHFPDGLLQAGQCILL